MILQYTAEMLVPAFLRSGQLLGDVVPEKQMSTRAPLTPFFFPNSSSGEIESVGLSGFATFAQFFTRGDETEVYCGRNAYKIKTETETGGGEIPPGEPGAGDPYTYEYELVSTLVPTWNDGTQTFSIETDLALTETGVDWSVGTISTHTYTGSETFNTHEYEGTYGDRVETTTLSDSWSTGDVDGWLSTLLGKTTPFEWGGSIAAGGGGIIAHKSGGSSFRDYAVRAGRVKDGGPWFTDGWATGLVGSLATLWNGNFSVALLLRRRANAPTLRDGTVQVSSTEVDGPGSGIGEMPAYTNGYSQVELSDSTENYWAITGGGEFCWNPATDLSLALDGVPLDPIEDGYNLFNSIWSYAFSSLVVANQITFISADGRRYRIWIEIGFVGYDEFFEWVELWDEPISTEMADGETQATLCVTCDPPEAFETRNTARIAYIEYWSEEYDAWDFVIVDDYDALIGGDPRTSGLLLLAATQSVQGEPFGFYALDLSGGRYRTKTIRTELTTPTPVDLGIGGCGGGYPSGDKTVIYHASFSHGELLGPVIDEYSLTIDAVTWTQDSSVLNVAGNMLPDVIVPSPGTGGGWTEITRTATLWRHEIEGDATGRYLSVERILPDSDGEVLETTSIILPVGIVGITNVTDWSSIVSPPAAGSAWYVEESRLIY